MGFCRGKYKLWREESQFNSNPALAPSPQFNGEITEEEEVTWSNTNTQTNTFGWNVGVSETTTAKCGMPGEDVTMGETASMGATMSTTHTMTDTQGGSKTVSCETNTCSTAIFQWTMTGTAINGQYQNKDNVPTGKVTQCSFACTPSANLPPLCPPQYCMSADCQCCSGQWSAEPSNLYTICPGAPNSTAPPTMA